MVALVTTKRSQNPRTITNTKYLAFVLVQLLKSWGALLLLRHLLNVKVSKIMNQYELSESEKALHFNRNDIPDMCALIQRRRPNWAYSVIVEQLKEAALRGATLGQAISAAEKATNNQKAKTPVAISWPEHWDEPKSKSAGNMMGPRLCVECDPPRKHAITELTKRSHGWVCKSCEEAA